MQLQKTITHSARELGRILTDNGMWITTAESCTGGGISYAITDTPGSSRYLAEAYVTYSNQAKMDLTFVPQSHLKTYGAVSDAVVKAMATGAQKRAQADVAIAVSGVAGPTGGSAEKPVGLVWFGFAIQQSVYAESHIFQGDRASIRAQTIAHALTRCAQLINS